ncbi:MAG: porin, partial [Planctomycetota bacterium]
MFCLGYQTTLRLGVALVFWITSGSFLAAQQFYQASNSSTNYEFGRSLENDFRSFNESLGLFYRQLDEQEKQVIGNAEAIEKLAASFEEFLESSKEEKESFKELQETVDELESDFDDELRLKTNSGHSKSKMKIVGRVHVDYWGFPESSPGIDILEGGPAGPQDRFNFRRMRFGVRGDLPSNMDYRIEMEFAGGNDAEFRDAWLGFKDLPGIGKLLIGNQKRPYGLDHLNSSRYNVFLERPFIIESFNQDARRLGIQSYNTSEDQSWNWRLGAFNQRLIQDEGNYTNDHWQPEFAGRMANTYWYDEGSGGRGYAHWAVSGSWAFPDGSTPSDNGSTGPDANEARFRHRPEARSASRWLDTGRIAGADNYRLLGLEKVFNYGPLQVVGEYQTVGLTRDAGSDLNFHGGYVYASYFLTGEHMPWSRSSGTLGRIKPFENFFFVRTEDCCTERGLGAWQVAARYSYADLNSDDIFGGVGESLTLGHTGSLAGSQDLYRALFDRTGVIVVTNPSQLLETLKFLCVAGAPAGRDILGFTASGGGATMLADHAEIIGLSFPKPGDKTHQQLEQLLP